MAPTTSTQRMAKLRAKLKDDPHKLAGYHKKDRERNKINRKKEKEKCEQDEDLQRSKREATRLRVQEWRKKKALESDKSTPSISTVLGSYSTASTLRKAVYKVRRNLPFSPSKKKAVVRQLLKETFADSAEIVVVSKQIPKSGPRSYQKEDLDKIIEFYSNDDVSWQTPGKRDCVTVKNKETGIREKKQKRYLILSVREAYEHFTEINPELKVSLSKFYELRPKHVRPVSETPHNVCVCVKHANFAFLVEAISPFLAVEEGQSSHILTSKLLIKMMCCDPNAEHCMRNNCKVCHYNIKAFLKPDCDLSQNVKWKCWTKCEAQLTVQEKISDLNHLIIGINEALPPFKAHVFVKTKQSNFFDETKKTLKQGEAVMQIDYAENYSLISQDEIQSAHWRHTQTTIFTCCLWLQEKTYSYAVVSDDVSHSKESAWVFIKSILSDFQRTHPDVSLNHLYIFSDNCSSQFKSRYTVFNVCFLPDDLNIETVEWNYFAAGHGKGAVDAIGGQLKRMVWTAVKSRRVSVCTPEEFFLVATEQCKATIVLYVTKTDVDETSVFLNKRWEKVRKTTGIRDYHHFQRIDSNHVGAGFTSESNLQKIQIQFPDRATLNRTSRWRCSDVYSSDSDDVAHNSESDVDDETPVEQASWETVLPGSFVKVNITGEGKCKIDHRYMAVCQTAVEETGDLTVLFLKKYGTTGKMFISDEQDEKVISSKQVECVFPAPAMKEIGSRVVYEFKNKIADV